MDTSNHPLVIDCRGLIPGGDDLIISCLKILSLEGIVNSQSNAVVSISFIAKVFCDWE